MSVGHPAILNDKVDKNVDFTFDISFFEDDEVTEIDVSSWTFHYILRDVSGATIWDIPNGSFTRIGNNRITFTKTTFDLASLSSSSPYFYKLYVTRAATVDDIYMEGQYQFSDE